MKKKWHKPELVVLVRNRPEEGLLDACKQTGYSGPEDEHQACNITLAPCEWCSGWVGS